MKKIKLALISPGKEGSVVSGRWKGIVNFYRLTLPLLAGLTPKDKYDITVYDESVDRIPKNSSFDLVAMTVMTPYANRAYELSQMFKQKGAKVLLGGHHPTLLPNEASKYADSIVIGDAEHNFPQVLDDFEHSRLKKIYNNSKIGIKDYKRVYPERKILKNKSLLTFNTLETSRGCPYLCDYCTIASFYKAQYQKYDIDSVLEDINSTKGKFIFFVDDNLIGGNSYDKRRTKELLTQLKSLNKKWFCQSTINLANDPELLKLASDAGCVGVYLGLESISKDSLKEVRKSWNKPESYIERIKKIRDYGIAIEAGLIFGFDNDSFDVFDETAEFILKTEIESPNAHLLTPYPGTPLFDKMQEQGRILTYDWDHYNTGNVVFQPKLMSPEQLLEGYIHWYQKVFSTSTIFSRIRKANFKYYTALINLAKNFEVRREGFDSKALPNYSLDCLDKIEVVSASTNNYVV